METDRFKSMLSDKYRVLRRHLNEKTLRLCAAADARCIGRGGISIVAQAADLARNTIYTGLRELEETGTRRRRSFSFENRVRREGGGRKKLTETDSALLEALDHMVGPLTRGDPQSPLRWTCKSTTKLAKELLKQGHAVSQKTVWNLLDQVGYSMQSNRKRIEGTKHPDRDAQFQFISGRVEDFISRKQPVVSVDTKKKELIGNFKNVGQEWQKKGEPVDVNIHDFANPDLGKIIPYGVYDIAHNKGWIGVGITHDTAEFAVQTLRTWWHRMGIRMYPRAKELMIAADGGGSNGWRVRLWKIELQKLANDLNMTIHVCHFPPGTSKWNKIEHRMFCHITENWRGRPLISRAVVVNLISSTRTETGLHVEAILDKRRYDTGIKIPDEEMSKLSIEPYQFHGDWNYRVKAAKIS